VEILGQFRGVKDSISSLLSGEWVERVIGICDDLGYVTLTSVNMKSSSFGDITKSAWNASKVYSGVGFSHEEIISFNEVRFSVDGLDDWLSISAFETTINYETTETTIKYSPSSVLVINLSEDQSLEIDHSMRVPSISSWCEAKIEKRSYFKLKYRDPKPIEVFTKVIHQMLTFMTFAMDEKISLNSVKAIVTVGNGFEKEEKLIDVYFESYPFFATEPKIDRSKFVFNFQQINLTAEAKIHEWLNLYENIKPTLDLYFAAKSGVYEYIDGKFLALTQSIETFHRRWNTETLMSESEYLELLNTLREACPVDRIKWLEGRLLHGNELSLAKRLNFVLNKFSSHIRNSGKISKTVRKIVDTRNYLTHFSSELESSKATFAEMVVITRLIDALHKVLFMDLVGFTDEEIRSTLANNPNLNRSLACLE